LYVLIGICKESWSGGEEEGEEEGIVASGCSIVDSDYI
jgi:hypothetical protein